MRAKAIEGILCNYRALLMLFEDVSGVTEPDLKSRIRGTRNLLKDFHIYFGKFLFYLIVYLLCVFIKIRKKVHSYFFQYTTFIFDIMFSGLKLAYSIFGLTDTLSAGLQSSQLSCADGSEMSRVVVDKLKEMRSAESFRGYYSGVEKDSESIGKNLTLLVYYSYIIV